MTNPFDPDPFGLPGYGPQPGASDFFDSMILNAARTDPVIQNLFASSLQSQTTKPVGPDWYTPDPTEMFQYQGIPEGSHYNKSKDAWLLPDGTAIRADFNTRPVVNNFGKAFSSAFAK